MGDREVRECWTFLFIPYHTVVIGSRCLRWGGQVARLEDIKDNFEKFNRESRPGRSRCRCDGERARNKLTGWPLAGYLDPAVNLASVAISPPRLFLFRLSSGFKSPLIWRIARFKPHILGFPDPLCIHYHSFIYLCFHSPLVVCFYFCNSRPCVEDLRHVAPVFRITVYALFLFIRFYYFP